MGGCAFPGVRDKVAASNLEGEAACEEEGGPEAEESTRVLVGSEVADGELSEEASTGLAAGEQEGVVVAAGVEEACEVRAHGAVEA